MIKLSDKNIFFAQQMYIKYLRGCLNFIQNDVFLLLVSQRPKVRKDFNMDNPVHSAG